MFKNGFTCGIPHGREQGNEYAAALGYVAALPSRGLECLDGVRGAAGRRAREIVRGGQVWVGAGEISSRIYIRAEITTSEGSASVTIEDSHTNVTKITENDCVVYEKDVNSRAGGSADPTPLMDRYTLGQLIRYVETVRVGELQLILRAYDVNMALFHQALVSKRPTLTHELFEKNGSEVIGVQHINHYAEERCQRAPAFSYLVCMCIKEYSGRLSAFCGCAIGAGTGMACGIWC